MVGLTDSEYLGEPVPGSWSVRRSPSGAFVADGPPDRSSRAAPSGRTPVPTLAWRIAHIGVGCFVVRTSAFFGDDPALGDADMFDARHKPDSLPGTAEEALDVLDEAYARWLSALRALDDEAMARPLGAKGGPFRAAPMAGLVAHVNREVMHHGGEIGLLRDLYASGAADP